MATDCGGQWSSLPAEELRGFAFDSRCLRPGELFLALRTGRRDGHDFVPAARQAGAAAALVERLVPGAGSLPQLVVKDVWEALERLALAARRRYSGRVIGITGSCGKTSVTALLRELLGGGSRVHSTEGNWNNRLGLAINLCRLDLADAKPFAVFEAGISVPGDMGPLARMLEPGHAILTMIAGVHLEGFGSIERIAAEKGRLLRAVPSEGSVLLPALCLNHPFARELAASIVALAPWGEAMPAGVRGEWVPFRVHPGETPDQDVLELASAGRGPERYRLPPMTRGMQANAAIAVEAARRFGQEPAEVCEGLSRWRPADRRGRWMRRGGQRVLVDCYNANPASLHDTLEFFIRSLPLELPRLYVLGGMRELGNEAEAAHRRVGSWVPPRPQDRAVLIGEYAGLMVEGLEKVGWPGSQLFVAADAEEAEPVVERFSGAVLVKGSRHYALERLLKEMESDDAAVSAVSAALPAQNPV